MEEQINRNILDNFDVSSVENHELYKMNGAEILKGLENGSLHFVTVPREEFIDHSLLPEYITTSHGFIIDEMLDSTDDTTNESSQMQNTFANHSSYKILPSTDEIQVDSNLDEDNRRLNAALFQYTKDDGSTRELNNAETEVIVTNKDFVSLTGSQILEATVKNGNSNSLDANEFLSFDDQQSLTSSLINDSQFRIFQQSSSNNDQSPQSILMSSSNNSLPQLSSIKKLPQNCKTVHFNIPNQNFEQRSIAKKVLPHKKRITKKLISFNEKQRTDPSFQQSSNNSLTSVTNQIQYFPEMQGEINTEEVINMNTTTQFSCEICGLRVNSQIEFFGHLKLHYEPQIKSDNHNFPITTREEYSTKKSNTDQSQRHFQLSVNQPERMKNFQQLTQTKKRKPNVPNQKTQENHIQSSIINETSTFHHLQQIKKHVDEKNNLSNLINLSMNESGCEQNYIITDKNINETRELHVSNLALNNFSQINPITHNSNTNHSSTSKDIIGVTNGYPILNNSIKDSQQVQLPKGPSYLNLQGSDKDQLNSKIIEQQQNHILIHRQTFNSINQNEQKSHHSQQLFQNSTIYNQSTTEGLNSRSDQNLFENVQYFETKFTGLPNQVLNLEQKIDAVRAESATNTVIDQNENIINRESISQSSLICGTQHSLHNQIQIANAVSINNEDGTENITPSITELHDETTIHSDSQKSTTNDIVILQNEEVEFSDSEDMLEGIRGVVDKVQEAFDTGDEMEPISRTKINWFPNNTSIEEINAKSNNESTYSQLTPTTSVENFQIFFKSELHNDKKIKNEPKLEFSNEVLPLNSNINTNCPLSEGNSLGSSTTNTVMSHTKKNREVTIKMENFSSDFDNSWPFECEKIGNSDKESNESSFFTVKSKNFTESHSSVNEVIESPSVEKLPIKKSVSHNKKEKKHYFCEKCSKIFNSLNALKYHELSHTGERQFPCEECGKRFLAQNALRAHMRVHSGEKPFTCIECGRAFRQWSDLNYHRTSLHSNEKNFQCEFCGKAFARKYSLVIHRRIHTQEKNYKCDFCPKTFRASSYLQNHRKIHTGEKPYECPICSRKFRVCGDLKRHRKIHDRIANNDLKNILTIRLPDTVINIQTQEHDKDSIAKACIEPNRNKMDVILKSTVQMFKSDKNLNQVIKTDNVNKNNNSVSNKNNKKSSTILGAISNKSTTIASKKINKSNNNEKNISISSLPLSLTTTTFTIPTSTYIKTKSTNVNKNVTNKYMKKNKYQERVT